jgi:anhydro-N-acetylmuramic acid kinase
MSGTSLDGLDIAHCIFTKKDRHWLYSMKASETVRYPRQWNERLSQAHTYSAEQLLETDVAYGKFLGQLTAAFITKNKVKADFIASHGHTIFHQPKKSFTYQIGNGNALHAATGLPVVFDFRSLDVILGGEGAPLVPAGDKFLFSEYDICLNLGGIANLSMDVNRKRKAFDVCFTNMGLNYLAMKAGKTYDANGAMASGGEVNAALLKDLSKIYKSYHKKRPSLGREMFENQVRPLLDQNQISNEDKLCTFVESAAKEIVNVILSQGKNPKVLITGGGAFNSFLISRMLDLTGDKATLIIPDDEIVKFKEALVFAFLGVLRVRDEVNCLQSVTGASQDSSSGVLVGF